MAGLFRGDTGLGRGTGLSFSKSLSYSTGLASGTVATALLTAGTYGNAPWTTSTNIQRFQGPWTFAPLEPGISLNVAAISNANQQPTYDTRQDVIIYGNTHFSPPSTILTGGLQVGGGKKVVVRGIDVGGATGGKIQMLKMAQMGLIEGIAGDFSTNPVDQDGLVVGGCSGAKLTATASGLYLSVTARTFLTINNSAGTTTAATIGDLIIGGSLQNNGALAANTKIADFGKVNVIGSISGTTLTTTSEVGAPIIPGTASDGMMVMIDGGIEVGRVTAGSPGSWTITNAAGVSVPAGSRIFIESRGGIGSYKLDQSNTVSSGTIDFFPPTPAYYGITSDVPTDRLAQVALNYGPVVLRQTNRMTGTHGTNKCKFVLSTPSIAQITSTTSLLNSGVPTSVQMISSTVCRVTFANPLVANAVSKGAWAGSTAYIVGDFVTQGGRTYVCYVNHTSAASFATDRYTKWYPSGAVIAGIFPMGAWTTATAYLRGDAVTQGGITYLCASDHTAGTFATDLGAGKWKDPAQSGNQTGFDFKLSQVGYDPGGGVQTPAIGWFNRDWHINSSITTGGGGVGTVIDLVTDSSYAGGMPPNGAVGVLTSALAILMGCPYDAAAGKYSTVLGEHADSMGQTDKEKFLGFLGTDLTTGTSSYQAGGITSNSSFNDTTEEYSRNNLLWVLGLIPGEDAVCNIGWSGMQQVTVTKSKRWWLNYADIGARTWVPPANAPFPNPNLSTTNTPISYAQGTDGASGLPFLAYGGAMFGGGWLFGSPAAGDFAPVGRVGFGYSTNSPYSYSGQRDPSAAEMTGLTFTHDTGDTLMTAAAGTHIGWFALSAPTLPGALANGNRVIVDPVPRNTNFVGLGSASTGARATRGPQAVPLGNNPVFIDCTVRGTSITAAFGPFNFIGAPAPATTTLVVSPQLAVGPATGASPYTFTAHPIGTAAADRDVYVAVELAWTTSRTINAVSIGGIAASRVTLTPVTSNNVRLEFWKATVPTGTTADIVVTTSGSVNAVQVYVWACTGVGLTYYTATAIGSAPNVGASVTVATPANGAILAAHMYASAASGGNRRSSAMALTGTSKVDSQTVSGTVTSATNIDWNVGTELTNGEQQVTSSGTGASLLSVLVLGPAYALDANYITPSIGLGNVVQPGTVNYTSAAGVVTVAATATNLLVRSQEFHFSSWVKAGTSTVPTITVDTATAPDGTLTADTWARVVTNPSYVFQSLTKAASALTYTMSAYVKQSTARYLAVRMVGTYPSRADVVFDLNAGTVSTAAFTSSGFTAASATITPVGSGWYRVTLTATTDATATVQSMVSFNANGVVVDGTDSSATSDGYIWGAQLEQAASASGYIPTTTAAVTNSLPRFDYASGLLRGVLVEPARTNICLQSQSPADANWATTAAAKTSTNNADPFGTSTALLITADGTNSAHYGFTSSTLVSYTTGLAYTISCFVKAGTQSIVQLTMPAATFSTLAWANFDLAAGTVGTVTGGTATITPVGNGWYRVSLTATSTATATASGGVFTFVTSSSATRLEVNTLATNFYVAGWQAEQGSTASSYIPTTTVAVTRAADALKLIGINKADGTYKARCWHQGGDFTDVAGVAIASGGASISGISTKPIQGISFI